MAAIFRESYFSCGGTLINEGWVLTAASCDSKDRMHVALGAHSRLNKRVGGRQTIAIANTFVYPCYSSTPLEHDLMLLKLQKKAVLTQNVQVIQLPSTSDDIQPGTSCLATGWGETNGKESSNALHEVNITIIERSICIEAYATVTMNMSCAGDRRGRKGTCQGDGGSPLICGAEQKGIVSFGIGCGNKQYPDVFTRLTRNYVAWIKKIIIDHP